MKYLDHGWLSRKFFMLWVYCAGLIEFRNLGWITNEYLFFGGWTLAIFFYMYILHRTELEGLRINVGAVSISTKEEKHEDPRN